MEAEALVEADPINPMRLFHELSSRLPANAIVAADSARQRTGTQGTCGSTAICADRCRATWPPWVRGCPYGIGAKFGNPDRPVFVFAGDGAMQMNGLAELITIKHYWQEWSDPRLVIAVLHNNDLNQVTWEMRAMEGAPKFAESQTLPERGLRGFAASLGLRESPSTSPMTSARPGTGRWPPTGRRCWTCAATRTCRRSRRTPRSIR